MVVVAGLFTAFLVFQIAAGLHHQRLCLCELHSLELEQGLGLRLGLGGSVDLNGQATAAHFDLWVRFALCCQELRGRSASKLRSLLELGNLELCP